MRLSAQLLIAISRLQRAIIIITVIGIDIGAVLTDMLTGTTILTSIAPWRAAVRQAGQRKTVFAGRIGAIDGSQAAKDRRSLGYCFVRRISD